VSGSLSLSASTHNGADFASGTGGVVNNGSWAATPHENAKRLANFNLIMDELKAAGMGTCTTTGSSGTLPDDSTSDDKTEEKEESESESEEPADSGAQCPPAGWEGCSDQWPPPADGYCCSSGGWLGNTDAHCAHINALDECCEQTEFRLKCKLPPGSCEDPPSECTGDPKIDAVLKKSDIGCQIGLTKMNEIYTWDGFCTAIRQFNSLDGGAKLFLGDDSSKSCGLGLANIAALLAQSMWESGGEAPFSACDENNYVNRADAACTQRSDGSLYASLNDQEWACEVDPQMTMTAETAASWVTMGPMNCAPGTVTEGCCWWGRGAIQTTGPNNYGLLNREVIQKIPALKAKNIDLCTNPEAICQNDETKWLGAIFYWANNV